MPNKGMRAPGTAPRGEPDQRAAGARNAPAPAWSNDASTTQEPTSAPVLHSQQAQWTDNWPKLRSDLSRVRTRDENGLVNTVIDPLSGEAFEFGEEEGFLLTCLDGTSGPDATMSRFREKFDLDITPEQLDEFIAMLRGWHLLDEPGAAEAASASSRKLPAVRATPDAGEQEPPGGAAGPAEDDLFEDDFDEIGLDGDIPGHYDDLPPSRPAGRPATDMPEEAGGDGRIWRWFNPDCGFAAVAGALRPFRHVRWLVPILAIAGLAGLFNNLDAFVADFQRFRAPLSLFQNLLFSMITINLLVQFMSGVVARGIGVPVPAFGIRMVFGLIPRFAIETGNVDRMERSARYWFYGGPLLVRAALFGVSVALWLSSRGTGTGLPVFFLLLIVASIISFTLASNPLHKGNGYGLLKTMVGIPNLRQKAFAALFGGKGGKGRAAAGTGDENRRALQAFALASLIYLVFFVGLILTFVARWLELNYQGTGVSLFLVLLAFLAMRMRAQMKKRGAQRRERAAARSQGGRGGRVRRGRAAMNGEGGDGFDEAYEGGRAAGPGGGGGRGGRPRRGQGRGRPGLREGQLMARQPGRGGMPARARRGGGRMAGPMEAQFDEPQKPKRRWPRYVLLVVVLVVMALPYPYETGGPLQILPIDRQELTAETAGVIAEVMVGGGESLEAGTYVARMSSSEQEKNVGTTRAAILEQQAKLEELLNQVRAEDVALARKRLETARTKAAFSAEAAARMEKLYATGTISLDDYDSARRTMEVDKAQVVEEQANLARVQGGAHPQEIEAARYELQRLEEQLKFYERELEDTRFVMPFDGRVVTMNLRQSVGQYLNKGEVFAVVENDATLRVDLKIPESDISEVSIGSATRIKIWAYPDKVFTGEVTEISPVVEAETFGRVVTVTTVIGNEEGLLKTGMTGFGKIDGGTKPVIVAFTRMIVRFFRIEIWSWIP